MSAADDGATARTHARQADAMDASRALVAGPMILLSPEVDRIAAYARAPLRGARFSQASWMPSRFWMLLQVNRN
jgi:hypothetical protein